MAFGALGAADANASYMSNCNKLIAAWEKCTSAGGACKAEKTAIDEQCKCHRLKQGEWKLVTAAVGDDGVCGKPPEDIIIPPPPPPPPTNIERVPDHDKGGDPPKDPPKDPGGNRGDK